MSKDVMIIIFGWVATSALLVLFTPNRKVRHAILIFLFKQFITWGLGLLVVQLDLIEYPVRSFPKATKSSFGFEYFMYPAFCVLFNLHYPKTKKAFPQFMYYSFYCSVLSFIEVIVVRYTNIINYIRWTWHLTWISFFITFYIARRFYLWFFNLKEEK